MAEHEADIPEMDYAAHNATYERFINGTKYAVIAIAGLLIAMALFL